MSDQLHQARAVRVQSSAIVMAAVITTCGAVTSALIQTGVTVRPAPAAANGPGSIAAGASSGGAVELAPETTPDRAQAAANLPAVLTTAAVAFHAPVELPGSSPSGRKEWTVAKPAIAEQATTPFSGRALPLDQGAAKPVVSPWYYFSHPDGQAAPKSTKKSVEWSGLAKMIPWLN